MSNELSTTATGSVAMQDARVDMFSARGFALAQRIAGAFASSDAVPAQFRSHILKKVDNKEVWVENSAALGNCIVAIEVAQAVGMSVTGVMQNADIIEGKLRWSDKFVVAGINASRRFTPLRFAVTNEGPIEASYKEKTGWDSQARRPIFTDRTVKLENLKSVAWALPYGFPTPAGIYTLDQAKAAGLPVIEGAPVSMRLAVEEGWYAKPGSKWQTELKHKMLMMRSGRFFGDIHAPDVVMGIGRTSDEEQDIIDVEAFEPAPTTSRKPTVAMPVEITPAAEPSPAPSRTVDQDTGEIIQPTADTAPAAAPAAAAPRQASSTGALASEGERKMIVTRAKNNGLDLRAMLEATGLSELPDDLDGLTKDGWLALKDQLPKVSV